jgi:hypothetical protein
VNINPITSQILSPDVQPIQPIGNTQEDKESPSMVPKTNQCGDSESPSTVKQMSTEDLLKLIMAMEVMEKVNEVTQDVLGKYVDTM